MPISMRHLLASSAVAGLLVLLPVGDANAQDNRNTWGWGAAGGVMLSFIAIAAAGGAVGGSSITSWLLLQRKGKRDDNLETIKSDFTKLSDNVKELDIQLEGRIKGVSELTGTLGNKIDNLSNNNKALNDLVLESLEQFKSENKPVQASTTEEEPEPKYQKLNNNRDKQWKIMESLCREFYKNDKKNQKISPSDCLQLINVSNSVNCYDCLTAVKKLLPDSLEVLPEADKSAKDHKKFTNIDQLFELLWKLGTDFQEGMQREESRSSEVAQAIFSKGQYAPHSSKEDKGGKRKPASVQYKGETMEMDEHLKIGGGGEGAPENSCLRIHFSWDVESKKVLIGHCGKHL